MDKELLSEKIIRGSTSNENPIFNILNDCSEVDANTIWDKYENSRFCRPSQRNIKEIIRLENNIINLTDEYEFIRVSELVPIGIYNFLSGMSPNRSVQTNRNLEICSDLSVSLALEGLFQRKKHSEQQYKKLAGFNTTFRPQNFKGANNFKKLPHVHFDMYGNAIVGQEKKEFYFTKKFLPELLEHYLKIITDKNSNLSINDIEIVLSYMPNTETILKKHGKTLHEFRDFQLRERTKTGIEPTLNEYLGTDIVLDHSGIDTLIKENNKGLDLSIGYLISIYKEIKKLEEKYPIKVKIKIGRSRGAGQYSSIAFSIFGTSSSGKKMDIADGGITDRGNKLLGPTERCLVGGLGIDLLSNYYK